MPNEIGNDQPTFAIRIAPSWDQLEPLRRYLAFWLGTRVPDDGVQRVGLVLQELLENAVKYGDPTSDVELSLTVSRSGNVVDLRVSNHAHPSRIAVLERELQRMRDLDPEEAFLRAMERIPKLPKGTSMLGLARIAVEATLECEIGGGAVTIRARVSAHHASRTLSKPSSAKIRVQSLGARSDASGTHPLPFSAAPPSGMRRTVTSSGTEPETKVSSKK
ncbi:MAG TPA: hypothetical protein VHE30_03445 [Polyangiaceae bacterium]|nr:hypothetical protein [Polyangiaceae bacterium]